MVGWPHFSDPIEIGVEEKVKNVAEGTEVVEQKVPDLDLMMDEELSLAELAQEMELDFALNSLLMGEEFGQPLRDFLLVKNPRFRIGYFKDFTSFVNNSNSKLLEIPAA